MAKNVKARAGAGDEMVFNSVKYVVDIMGKMNIGNAFRASVNNIPCEPGYELKDNDYVVFSQKLKAGA